jgi:hypothetical protein
VLGAGDRVQVRADTVTYVIYPLPCIWSRVFNQGCVLDMTFMEPPRLSMKAQQKA